MSMQDTERLFQGGPDTILLVEDDVLVRTGVAEYLRHCGYRIIEVSSSDTAMFVLGMKDIRLDVVFSDIQVPGSINGVGLARWVRDNRPDLKMVLTGSEEAACNAAGGLCEKGPHQKKPYEPKQVLDWITQVRSSNSSGGFSSEG